MNRPRTLAVIPSLSYSQTSSLSQNLLLSSSKEPFQRYQIRRKGTRTTCCDLCSATIEGLIRRCSSTLRAVCHRNERAPIQLRVTMMLHGPVFSNSSMLYYCPSCGTFVRSVCSEVPNLVVSQAAVRLFGLDYVSSNLLGYIPLIVSCDRAGGGI